jgi:DNA-binding transcriptional MerR regulator
VLKAFPVVIPDEVLDFEGPAAELADRCNEVLPENGLAKDAGVANERLIRHYVQLGVLTSPVRRGREAIFGARQVAEFVVARMLLNDGWPLAKIAELIQAYELPIPVPVADELDERDEPTPAERAVARIHAAASEPVGISKPVASMSRTASSRSRPDSLTRAADLSARRLDLADTLRSLGNAAGVPDREEVLRIRLTPWATVDLDARQLRRLGPDAVEALGKALVEALRQERITGGDKQ